jgi:hypothetical protein
MSTVTFENGKVVNFAGTPTPADIEEVAQQMGMSQQAPTMAGHANPEAGLLPGGQYTQGVANAFSGGVDQIKQGYNEAMGANGNPLPMVGGAVKSLAGVVNAVASPLAPFLSPISAGVNYVADKISDIPAVQQFANSPLGNAVSGGVDFANDLNTVVGGIAGAKSVMEAKPTGVVDNSFTGRTTPEPPPPGGPGSPEMIANQKIIVDTMKATTDKYGVSRNLLYNMENRNGTNPLGVISSYGNRAIPQIVPGRGVVNPIEAIDFLNERIASLSEVKGEAVELSNKPTQVNDVDTQVKGIVGQQGWTKLQQDRTLAQIGQMEGVDPVTGKIIPGKGELGALENSYPDGNIPLAEIDKLKSYEANLSKSYNNKSAGPFELDAHAILAKVYRKIVEDNTDSDVIREYNKYIQSHYDAIELLRSLENKTPHGGMLTRQFQRIGAEAVGAGAGAVFGGGPIGAVLGGAVAGSVVDTVMGIMNDHFISNPLKRMLIKNMPDVPDPVIQKMLDYVDRTKTGISNAKAQNLLTAPKEGSPRSSVGSGQPIPMIPGKAIEYTGPDTVGTGYKPPKMPKGRMKGTTIERMAGEQYIPPDQLPIIKL